MPRTKHALPTPTVPGASPSGVVAPPAAPVALHGAELVAITERFYRSLLGLVSVVSALIVLVTIIAVPVNKSSAALYPPLAAVVAGSILIGAVVVGVWRIESLYRLLRLHRGAELVLVAIAAGFSAEIGAFDSTLSFSAFAILVILATVAGLKRAMAYCMFLLFCNLAANVLLGDFHKIPAVTTFGIWFEWPLCTVAVAVIAEQASSHLLRHNTRLPKASGPVSVTAWTDEQPAHDNTPLNDEEQSTMEPQPPAAPPGARRLTARQLQVALLLTSGLQYRDVAAALAISERQVQRHVADAVSRSGVRNANELVAVIVAGGLVPPPQTLEFAEPVEALAGL